MIPVSFKTEPKDFNINVRIPGQAFLVKFANPTKDDWNKKGKKIWQRCSSQLRTKYKGICAYVAEWIYSDEKSVDHFIPKSKDKTLAFEWSNFRLSLDIVNQNKGDEIVIDPFKVEVDWFVIDFELNLVKSNKEIKDMALRKAIDDTITQLKLNDLVFKKRRYRWIGAYYKGSVGLDGLRKKAPFIVYELERQNYQEKIKEIYARKLAMTKHPF